MGHVNQKRLAELIDDIQSVLAFDQPGLHAKIHRQFVKIEGIFVVSPTRGHAPTSGGALGSFRIGIFLDGNFPFTEPAVVELDGRIPRTPDHHINDDGTCCLEVWEAWLANHGNASVQDFFDGPLRNFFLGQLHKKATGSFPFGEHEHGAVGVIAAYAELLGCGTDIDIVRNHLHALTQHPPRGHWDCPCNSGKRIRNCCREKLLEIGQRVPPQLAKQMLRRITPSR